MPDKYDEAVAFLTAHPEKIYNAWIRPSNSPASCLFDYVTKTHGPDDAQGRPCGCLTTIRAFNRDAETRELQEAIIADERIPKHPGFINVSNLPVFAEWQRRINRELNRAV